MTHNFPNKLYDSDNSKIRTSKTQKDLNSKSMMTGNLMNKLQMDL